jgi:hypothetical protein
MDNDVKEFINICNLKNNGELIMTYSSVIKPNIGEIISCKNNKYMVKSINHIMEDSWGIQKRFSRIIILVEPIEVIK